MPGRSGEPRWEALFAALDCGESLPWAQEAGLEVATSPCLLRRLRLGELSVLKSKLCRSREAKSSPASVEGGVEGR